MLKALNLKKQYKPKNGQVVNALDDVSIEFAETGMVFILGKSGSGKSTLLNVLGGLDKYDSGEVIVKGKSSKNFSQADFDSYRNTFIGFIFQEYNILQEFSVEKNIGLALELQGKKADKEAINTLIEQVDLKGYGKRKPNTLSGGQKQRVAIARALVKNPEIIMADEPTGALDSKTGAQVLDTLKKLSKEKLVIVVSHDREFAEYYGDRIIELQDGKIISDQYKHEVKPMVSNGIEIVDDKVLTIKKGTKLTNDNLDEINRFLLQQSDDVIISVDEGANKEFKKFAKINDEGLKETFTDTTSDDVKIKEYDGNVKLIRSKLPMKDSFKMGASGLKTKRFRLVLTILLSAIAFGMFGLADTMASYNKVDNTVQSIKDSHIDYAVFNQTKVVYRDGNQIWGSGNGSLTDEDIAELEQATGLKYLPVYKIDRNNNPRFYDNLYKPDSFDKHQEYTYEASGFVDSNRETIDQFGTIICGSEATTYEEMVITTYLAEAFKICGYRDSITNIETTINDYNDLIGKKVKINNKDFTISGILDTGLDVSRYSSLNEDKYDVSTMFLRNELENLKRYSSHALIYLKDGYFDKYVKSSYSFCYAQNLETKIYSYNDSSYEDWYYFNYVGEYFDNMDGVYFYDSSKTTLADNEIIIGGNKLLNSTITLEGTKYEVNSLLNSDKFWTVTSLYLSKYENLNSYYSYVGLESLLKYYAYIDRDFLITGEDKWSGDATDFNYYISDYGLDGEKVKAQLELFLADCEDVLCYTDMVNYLNNSEYKDAFTEAYNIKKNLFQTTFSQEITIRDYVSYMASEYANGNNFWGLGFTDNEITFAKICIDLIIEKYASRLDEYYVTVNYSWPYNEPSKDYKIVGVYVNADGNGSNRAISSEIYNKVKDYSSDGYAFVISKMNYNDDSLVRKLVKYHYNNAKTIEKGDMKIEKEYQMVNNVINMVENVNSFIETGAKVFLYVGIGFAVFASLLLLNFITISISYKKREIGVLRAIGARGTDVFKIFFFEAFIIAFINFVLAFIGLVIACYFLNRMFRTDYGFLITLLHIGIRQIVLMFGVSLGVAFISSFLPVRLIARKKPIDAIRSAE